MLTRDEVLAVMNDRLIVNLAHPYSMKVVKVCETCLALFEENRQKTEALAKCRCLAEHPLFEDCGKCEPCQAKLAIKRVA